MATFVLGMNAGLYQGVAGSTAPGSMTKVDNVRDVTLQMEAGECDITTRGNGGWRATAPTIRECTVEFQMVWKPGDAVFDAIKTAFLSAGTVALAVLDQLATVSGAQGPLGDFSILNFTRNEALEEAIVADVTAKLAVFVEWYEAGGA
ncbi:MAG: phage tail tube protein [Kiritimatiellae bacterium]|nr:phage tail tube protein [Kiritimatiellia bacterium]